MPGRDGHGGRRQSGLGQVAAAPPARPHDFRLWCDDHDRRRPVASPLAPPVGVPGHLRARRLAVRGRGQASYFPGRQRRCLPLARPRRGLGAAGHPCRRTGPGHLLGVVDHQRQVHRCPVDRRRRRRHRRRGPAKHTILFRFVNYGMVDGLDFATHCSPAFTVKIYVEGQLASPGSVHLGQSDGNPTSNPFKIERPAARAATSKSCPRRRCRGRRCRRLNPRPPRPPLPADGGYPASPSTADPPSRSWGSFPLAGAGRRHPPGGRGGPASASRGRPCCHRS